MTIDVPAPRKDLRWRLPESSWAGRALFLAAGLGAYAIWIWSVRLVGSVGNANSAASALALAAPAGLTLAVIVQRVRRGAGWRCTWFVAGLALLPIAHVTVPVVVPWVVRRVNARPFDAAAWQVHSGLTSSERKWMVDDLLERHPLVGRNRDEVEALLGPPDTSDTDWTGFGTHAYSVGRGIDILGYTENWEWLVLLYDSNDRVLGYGSMPCASIEWEAPSWNSTR